MRLSYVPIVPLWKMLPYFQSLKNAFLYIYIYFTIFEQLMILACRCLKHVVCVNICAVLRH